MPMTEVHRKSERRGPLFGQIFLDELTQHEALKENIGEINPSLKNQYIITKVSNHPLKYNIAHICLTNPNIP